MCAGSVLAEVWRGEGPLVVALIGVGMGWTLEGMCTTKSDGENVGGRSVVKLAVVREGPSEVLVRVAMSCPSDARPQSLHPPAVDRTGAASPGV